MWADLKFDGVRPVRPKPIRCGQTYQVSLQYCKAYFGRLRVAMVTRSLALFWDASHEGEISPHNGRDHQRLSSIVGRHYRQTEATGHSLMTLTEMVTLTGV